MEEILGNLKKGTTCTSRLRAPEPHTLVGAGVGGGLLAVGRTEGGRND